MCRVGSVDIRSVTHSVGMHAGTYVIHLVVAHQRVKQAEVRPREPVPQQVALAPQHGLGVVCCRTWAWAWVIGRSAPPSPLHCMHTDGWSYLLVPPIAYIYTNIQTCTKGGWVVTYRGPGRARPPPPRTPPATAPARSGTPLFNQIHARPHEVRSKREGRTRSIQGAHTYIHDMT